jgi:integrase
MVDDSADRIRKVWVKLADDDRKALLQELASGVSGRNERDGLYKRGRTWWVCFTVNGRQYRLSAKTASKEEAREFLRVKRLEAVREASGQPRNPDLTFAELADKYLLSPSVTSRPSWAQNSRRLKRLKERFGHMRAADVGRDQIEAYQRDRLADGIKGSSINRIVVVVRQVLGYGVAMGLLSVNPLAKPPLLPESPPRRPILESSEEVALLEACSTDWLRFLVRVLLSSGCRVSEVLALTFRDVDLERGTFIIRMSKSGESREVPIHPSIHAELKERRGLPDAHVITKADGTRPSLSGVDQAFRRAVNRATAPDVPAEKRIRQRDLRIHDLRHVFAIRAIASGLTAFEIGRILGHKDGSMVMRVYGDVTHSRIRELVSGIPLSEAPATDCRQARSRDWGKVVEL